MVYHIDLSDKESEKAGPPNSFHDNMRKSLSGLDGQMVKLYTTCLARKNRHFEFVTASKDIHLFLGNLGESGRGHLISLILYQLGYVKDGMILLTFGTRNGLIISDAGESADGEIERQIFHLSPAH